MTTRSRNNSKKQNKQKKTQVTVRPRNNAVVPSFLSHPAVRAWDQLLRDPCGSQIAAPCYAGVDSGYLIRTVDVISPACTGLVGLTVGSTVQCDFIVQYCPYNVSLTTGWVLGGNMKAVGIVPIATGPSNFITNAAVVKQYRPVAACLKWIPTGAISTRSGWGGASYNSGNIFTPGVTYFESQFMPAMQHQVTSGSEPLEVRWLPTATDENFTTTAAPSLVGGGTMAICLYGADSTATAATIAQVNGIFEVTTVWEWQPATNNDVAPSPKAPLPYTSQQVLSTISDMGAYLFHGVRTGAREVGRNFVQGGIAAASSAATMYMSGTSYRRRIGSAF